MARETWPARLMITSSPTPDPLSAARPPGSHIFQPDGHNATRARRSHLAPPYRLAATLRRWRPCARTEASSGKPTANGSCETAAPFEHAPLPVQILDPIFTERRVMGEMGWRLQRETRNSSCRLARIGRRGTASRRRPGAPRRPQLRGIQLLLLTAGQKSIPSRKRYQQSDQQKRRVAEGGSRTGPRAFRGHKREGGEFGARLFRMSWPTSLRGSSAETHSRQMSTRRRFGLSWPPRCCRWRWTRLSCQLVCQNTQCLQRDCC